MAKPDLIYPDFQDLGRADYASVLDLQRLRNQAVIDGSSGPTVFFVEHDPVITLTRRKTIRENLLASADQLAAGGITTHETDRGGDITYHGPGQLVVYPVLRLGDYGLNLSSYMRLLEQTVIDTLANWGIQGSREQGATGVWVDQQDHQTSAKVAAMGVRIRKNVTMHGLALNVDPDMSHFELIVPCGLAGRPVISMRQLLGGSCPSVQQVKQVLFEKLTANLEDAVAHHA